MNGIQVVKVGAAAASFELQHLVRESTFEGYRHIQRLADELVSGSNRFDGPGEALFAAYVNDQPVGVCGLNADPYSAQSGIGRVRRMYVLPAYRRQGVGRMLIEEVRREAGAHYRVLVLRTDTKAAAAFYERLGFTGGDRYAGATHDMELG
ncbi:GNAT family N-acetyltransferase [Paenibacillus silviterrae]|uniref:GNAT family N-acetyltransferase n=1 Tax=Paenibacillus silviterrae TaxID=3242194 RepID=UPI0025426F66|nr:GNAT family N-acetyltransferase [Paenibacillus chinjuensis]